MKQGDKNREAGRKGWGMPVDEVYLSRRRKILEATVLIYPQSGLKSSPLDPLLGSDVEGPVNMESPGVKEHRSYLPACG